MYQETIKVKSRCQKHPRYNPEKEGEASIRGGCWQCRNVFEVFKLAQELKRKQKFAEGADEFNVRT
jgi:hypothetical protein